jgi:Immunity protein 74
VFSIPRVNVIESDTGFSIEVLGRTGMRYHEGERTLLVDSEVLAPGKGIAVFSKSIKEWDPPHSGESITAEKRAEIVDNIRRAIEFQNQPIEIL